MPDSYERSKRLFDLAATVPAVVAISPLFAVVAVAIKLDSPGPVFYRGVRTGRWGRPFVMLKFRTMVVDAERLGTTTALHDPRITRVGRLLRSSKLDELPQLLNVLRGEMSIVGPRPEVEEHTREYDEEEKAILTVLPGITDYSSIRFVNLDEVLGTEDAHGAFLRTYRAEKNQLRLKYVRNRSLAEDLRITFRTVGVVLRHAWRRVRGPSGLRTAGC